jgi:5'-nucleotidase
LKHAVTVFVSFILVTAPGSAATTVTLLHFSDYHSHALPFYSEGGERQGGIAAAAGYLKRHKRDGAIVFNGGDMMNKGAPAWSDRYQCAEWAWLNGIVDAMAFGNHDVDYGFDAFRRCRETVTYPILASNVDGFDSFRVFDVRGVRIGVFAVCGADFPSLVKVPEIRFRDRTGAARETVRRLRKEERADAVVLIGHAHAQEDYALARDVPGIDLIFGTHSHLKQQMTRIPGTQTWFISPFQYLTYISRAELTFDENRTLKEVRGELVRIDPSRPVDDELARRVAGMQEALERDPRYRHLFEPFATLKNPMSVDEVADLAVEIMRDAADASVALSTISSFRQALPPGPIDLEALRAALPYDNEIVTAAMAGDEVIRLLAYGASRKGSDAFAVVRANALIDPRKTYRVATTDYLAGSAGYRDYFASVKRTGLRVREEVRNHLALTLPRQ